ncbi:hypothetical protein ACFRQM_33435 [Streptomyces sp. NPDC056831]|uniref:hypothetical protein n=1 Tax=Streptomyces sp. NPDC056831 TaxID=3345954 RepID=UPI003699D361
MRGKWRSLLRELRFVTDRSALTTVRAGRTVLATAPGAFRFRIGADRHIVRGASAASVAATPYASLPLGAEYGSGDHLHPNGAGMKAFADSIDPTPLGSGCS